MHEEQNLSEDLMAVCDENTEAQQGVELSTEREELLTLVGRNEKGNMTFVMLLKTQLAPNSKSVKIASVQLVKEPKHSKSDSVVAIVSDNSKRT